MLSLQVEAGGGGGFCRTVNANFLCFGLVEKQSKLLMKNTAADLPRGPKSNGFPLNTALVVLEILERLSSKLLNV